MQVSGLSKATIGQIGSASSAGGASDKTLQNLKKKYQQLKNKGNLSEAEEKKMRELKGKIAKLMQQQQGAVASDSNTTEAVKESSESGKKKIIQEDTFADAKTVQNNETQPTKQAETVKEDGKGDYIDKYA